MALVQGIEMNQAINSIVEAVRRKAKEVGIENGVVVICYSNRSGFDDEGAGEKCFQSLLKGEDSLRAFSLSKEGISFTESLKDDLEDFEHLGYAAREIAAAAKAYHLSKGHELTSRDLHSPMGYGGYVTYPLVINKKPCGKIYVAVAGGSERQNEACAWEAYQPIKDGIKVCKTTNPGPRKYGIIRF